VLHMQHVADVDCVRKVKFFVYFFVIQTNFCSLWTVICQFQCLNLKLRCETTCMYVPVNVLMSYNGGVSGKILKMTCFCVIHYIT